MYLTVWVAYKIYLKNNVFKHDLALLFCQLNNHEVFKKKKKKS